MGCGFESHRAYVSHAFLHVGVRTPFGRYAGALAGSRPDDLAATVVRGLLDRAPEVDPAQIGDVILGCANGAGEDNRNVGRMAVLLAGLPVSVPGLTVNRLCGSSLQAAMDASRLVETGDADLVVAGGVESMSRAPWVLPKPARGFPAGNETLVSTTLGWRLVNERMPAEWTASLGECNEQLADALGIGRERQDAFAVASHQRAAQAWDDGFYDALVLPVDGLARDECVRPDAGLESLAALKPAFRPDGTITAGNASPLNDGAAVLLIAGESAASRDAPARPDRGPWRRRPGAAAVRCRTRRGGRPGARRGRDRLGRRRRRGAQRGVRRAVPAPASTPGGSTPRSSTRAEVRSRSDTRSAPPVPACSARSQRSWSNDASVGVWPRSASVSARRLAVVLGERRG